ncbi:MAG: DUF3515 domain-containing protein, partial [Actinobacteria bacterium]
MTSSSNSHQSDLNRSEPNRPDSDRRATRLAALTATLVALPITVLVAVLAIAHVTPDKSAAPDDDGSATPTPHATAPVPMTAHELDERAEVICRALLARLPLTIRELSQRPVTAGHEQNA